MLCKAIVLVLAACSSVLAQAGGSLRVSAHIQPSLLLVIASPTGFDLSEGGTAEASVTIDITPTSQVQSLTFTNRVLEANNSGSRGYKLFARLATPINGKVVLDGVELRQDQNILIQSQLPYRDPRSHILSVSFASATGLRTISVAVVVKAD